MKQIKMEETLRKEEEAARQARAADDEAAEKAKAEREAEEEKAKEAKEAAKAAKAEAKPKGSRSRMRLVNVRPASFGRGKMASNKV